MWPTEANSPHVKANCKILNLTWNISHEFHMVFFMRISCRKNTCENHIKTMFKLSHEIHSKIYTGISLLLPVARKKFLSVCAYGCCCFWIVEWVHFFFMFSRVVEQSKENRMQVHNVAIVFGPTLIWPETVTPNLAANMIYQSRIVEYCLLEFKNIFRWKKAHYSSIKRMVLFVRKREWEKQSTKMNEFGAWMMNSDKRFLI